MRENLVNEISTRYKIERRELIEKDIIIHEILSDLSTDNFFAKNFLFKGGTCLVKSFIGYVRFSEDIDFTWKDQDIFKSKSVKELQKELSSLISKTGKIFENIAASRGLDFKCEKSNNNYVDIGGGGKICTFYIRYSSEILKNPSFLKVQINFVEKLLYSSQNRKLHSLILEKNEELKVLFSNQLEYLNSIDFETYDIKEILCEKIRAILTRQGTKARDFLDVYLICTRLNTDLSEIENNAVEKLKFSLEMYEKYRNNFEEKIKLIESEKFFNWGEEQILLLEDVEEKFYEFNKTLIEFLKKIISKVIQNE